MTRKSTVAETFLKYRSKLMRAVGSIVGADDIEDIVQEAFIKSYEAELKQEIQYERTYMLKTARNLALNHVAKAENKNKQQLDDMDILPYELVGHSLEKNVESKERFIHFCRATDTLSADVKFFDSIEYSPLSFINSLAATSKHITTSFPALSLDFSIA